MWAGTAVAELQLMEQESSASMVKEGQRSSEEDL